MFKKTFYTALMTSIFVSMPAMAGDKPAEAQTNHPAAEMEGSHDPRAAKEMDKHAEKYEEDLTHEGTEHPANRMEGSKDPRSAEEMDEHADKYKENVQKRERLKDADTSQHPAHEMGEGDELETRGN